MELLIDLTRTRSVPLAIQIARGVRDAVLHGRLSPGDRLPPTRELAGKLGVSRQVVVDAYEWLDAEGYVKADHSRGTWISASFPLHGPAALEATEPPCLTEFEMENSLIDFKPGLPAVDLFPRGQWRSALNRACMKAEERFFGYGPVEGLPRLRLLIARYVARTRGLPVTAERVMVTMGTAQTLGLVLRALEPLGDVFLENPGPEPVRRLVQLMRLRAVPVPLDEQGLLAEMLPENPPPFSLVHVIPSHQYPTGTAMRLERRRELISWAERTGAFILEDDYDSEFRYDQAPPAALAALDALERVIYFGSFSKTLFPGLRLGFCILPERFIERFLQLKWYSDRGCPVVEQLALCDWLESGRFEDHIRRMRLLYSRRRRVLLDELKNRLNGKIEVFGADAGMHLLIKLDVRAEEPDVIAAAAQRGVRVYPLSPCLMNEKPVKSGLILGFGNMIEEKITEGVRLLAEAIHSLSD